MLWCTIWTIVVSIVAVVVVIVVVALFFVPWIIKLIIFTFDIHENEQKSLTSFYSSSNAIFTKPAPLISILDNFSDLYCLYNPIIYSFQRSFRVEDTVPSQFVRFFKHCCIGSVFWQSSRYSHQQAYQFTNCSSNSFNNVWGTFMGTVCRVHHLKEHIGLFQKKKLKSPCLGYQWEFPGGTERK